MSLLDDLARPKRRRPFDERPDPFGRLSELLPEPDDRRAFDGPLALAEPVGADGRNRRDDVARIETLLDAAGYLDLGETDGPTGFFGQRLDEAIRRFQKDRGLKVDGAILPGGEIIGAFAEVTAEQPELKIPPGAPPPIVAPDDRRELNRERLGRVFATMAERPVLAPADDRKEPMPPGAATPSDPAAEAATEDGAGISAGTDGSTKDGGDLPPMRAPVPGPVIRSDRQGDGSFAASRDGGTRKHEAIDFEAVPGTLVTSPVTGTVENHSRRAPRFNNGKWIEPYPGHPARSGKLKGVAIMTPGKHRVRLLYVDPDAVGLQPGQQVEIGDPIGRAQDMARYYPAPKPENAMKNHVHMDVTKGNKRLDPTRAIFGR